MRGDADPSGWRLAYSLDWKTSSILLSGHVQEPKRSIRTSGMLVFHAILPFRSRAMGKSERAARWVWSRACPAVRNTGFSITAREFQTQKSPPEAGLFACLDSTVALTTSSLPLSWRPSSQRLSLQVPSSPLSSLRPSWPPSSPEPSWRALSLLLS